MHIVYLFVCHVPFPSNGDGFLLHVQNVQDKRALYKGAASRNFVHSTALAVYKSSVRSTFVQGSLVLNILYMQ